MDYRDLPGQLNDKGKTHLTVGWYLSEVVMLDSGGLSMYLMDLELVESTAMKSHPAFASPSTSVFLDVLYCLISYV